MFLSSESKRTLLLGGQESTQLDPLNGIVRAGLGTAEGRIVLRTSLCGTTSTP